MNSNTSLIQNSKPVFAVRPKSSRLPPLVPRSPDQDFRRRSSSFDYSFSESELDFQSIKNKSSNSPISDCKPKNTSDSVRKSLKKVSSEASLSKIPVLPRSPVDECQRLKNENQILKNNFLRMSRIIAKHSRLMAKKDEIILKLQEGNSRNYLPVIHTNSKTYHSQYEPGSLSLLKRHSIETSEELQSKYSEFSQKFNQIYDSMTADFSQHLTQFMKVIEEMQQFLENNLKVIDSRNPDHFENKSKFEAKLQTLIVDYSDLKNNYEELIEQHTDFKSFIEFMINSFNFESVKDLTSSQSISCLRQHFIQLLSKNQSLSDEINSIQKSSKTEEDYCFRLIECLSELEMELELTGRSPQTLSKVIEKLDQKLESIGKTLSQTYLQSLNKTLIQIYRNHLKWFQFVNKPSKYTQTWIQSRIDDSSTEDEEMVSDGKQLICCQISDSLRPEENVSEKNEISEEIKSKFDELSDEMSFDDFDVESINYILMAKYFDHNLKSNLEVVEEVEEENIEEEESESISYEDNVFEEVEECSDKCQNVSEYTETEIDPKNESNVENIVSVVEQVLNEILDRIDSQFIVESEETCLDNSINIDLNKKTLWCLPSTSIYPQSNLANENKINVVEVKPHYIDSDFVSDDLSSSPETVMTYQDDLNKPSKRTDHATLAFLTTFDELKQLNSRQSSEEVLAKTRIQELETILSEDQSLDDNQRHQSKENQYLSDELRAWKELVEQQKAIMEKIRNELELQQKLNNEKDKTIESLKSGPKSESLAEILENQTSIQQNSDKFSDVSDDECKTLMDELELNNLFNDNSESYVEVIEVNDSSNQTNSFSKSIDKKSPDIMVQEVWNKPDDLLEQNYVSDESSGYSVYTDNSSPLSVPEELLTTNRRKVFIPFSHEDAAVRRHSCQGRLIHYGNHPRKKKLELKNVEIVFQQQKVEKETRRPKINKIK